MLQTGGHRASEAPAAWRRRARPASCARSGGRARPVTTAGHLHHSGWADGSWRTRCVAVAPESRVEEQMPAESFDRPSAVGATACVPNSASVWLRSGSSAAVLVTESAGAIESAVVAGRVQEGYEARTLGLRIRSDGVIGMSDVGELGLEAGTGREGTQGAEGSGAVRRLDSGRCCLLVVRIMYIKSNYGLMAHGRLAAGCRAPGFQGAPLCILVTLGTEP